MRDVSPFALIVALVILGGCAWLALLPLWMYNRVKGIERALWAVVSQLQEMRQVDHSNDPVQRALRQRESPSEGGSIPLSMFGR